MRAVRTKGHAIWTAMKQRCLNPRHPSFHHYGGRGITVCDRWMKVDAFLEDMGQPPQGKWLERVDNDKGYCPDNCRWATTHEQMVNRRVLIEKTSKYRGVSITRNKRWHAQLHMAGKAHHLGNYLNEDDAARAYNRKAREMGYPENIILEAG